MAKKGIKFSEEHKRKLSESHKGVTLSYDHRNKISNSLKGIKISDEAKNKMSISKLGNKYGKANKGRIYSRETLRKMSESKKGKHYSTKSEFKKGKIPWNKGKKWPENSGENNNKWKGGISKMKWYGNIFKMRYRARKYCASGYYSLGEWELLKKQYNYTCPCCGRKEPDIKLTMDHIIPLSKGGSNNIENIQPLCKSCNCKKNTKIFKYENADN